MRRVQVRTFQSTACAWKPVVPGKVETASVESQGCIPQVPKGKAPPKELPSRSVQGPKFKVPSPHDLGIHHVLKPLRPIINPLVDTFAQVQYCALWYACADWHLIEIEAAIGGHIQATANFLSYPLILHACAASTPGRSEHR